ncbi:uncharacterized protein LOC116185647 [Apis dorsata]|uniref:uncharacterized protein LOC116185647 n=1 Tax=Apis dorsata TaxID=7462 RepID=UPI0012933ACB|nr:uncharacterized protein LOC116185647 [Apis dorsata]
MVSGNDCLHDETESSNITSLQTDSSCKTNTNINQSSHESVCQKDSCNNNFQQFNFKDCKCREIHSIIHGISSEEIDPVVVESYNNDLLKDKNLIDQTLCQCHARKM